MELSRSADPRHPTAEGSPERGREQLLTVRFHSPLADAASLKPLSSHGFSRSPHRRQGLALLSRPTEAIDRRPSPTRRRRRRRGDRPVREDELRPVLEEELRRVESELAIAQVAASLVAAENAWRGAIKSLVAGGRAAVGREVRRGRGGGRPGARRRTTSSRAGPDSELGGDSEPPPAADRRRPSWLRLQRRPIAGADR